MRREEQRRDPKWWQWAFPLVGLAFVIYLNTLSNQFVFDDFPLIRDSPEIRSWRNVPQILGRHGYRPIRTLSYALNYWLFGPDPFYFHLTNILLHAGNGILLFFLLKKLFQNTALAWIGASLFVSHPAQTAAVAYISGRKDLLAAGFLMAGFLVFARYRENQKKSALLAALLLFSLALFSKEVAVVFPALLFGWDVLIGHSQRGVTHLKPLGQRTWRVLTNRRWFYGSLLMIATAFLYYAQFVTFASRKVDYWGGSVLNNYLTSIKLFSHYLQLALVPYPLIADYSGIFPVATGLNDWTVWVGIAIALGYFYGLYQAAKFRPRMALGLFWFLVTLLPVLQLLPFHEIAANHFLYVPLIGLSLSAVDAVKWKLSRFRPAVIATAAGFIILVFSGATIIRNRDWFDTVSLWRATIPHAPGSARVHNNLGSALHATGEREEALPHLLRAIELEPGDAIYWSNLGALYHDLRDYEAAVEALSRAVRIDPKNPYTHTNLGNAYRRLALTRGDADPESQTWGRALFHLKRAVELNGADGKLHYNLGTAYLDLGRRSDAQRCFEIATRVTPDFGRAHYALGLMEAQDGDSRAAMGKLQRSIILDVNNLEAFRELATIHVRENDYYGARLLLEFAVGKFPNVSDLRLRLGLVYHKLGRTEDARAQLNLALQLDPASESANEIRQLLSSLK